VPPGPSRSLCLFVCLFVCFWRMGGLPSIEGVVVEVMKLLLGVQPCARRRLSIARQSCPSHAVMHVVRCNRYSAFNASRAVPSAQADSSAPPRAWHAAAVCSQKESLSGQCSAGYGSAVVLLSVAIARASRAAALRNDSLALHGVRQTNSRAAEGRQWLNPIR
jgi:hypothetical protein